MSPKCMGAVTPLAFLSFVFAINPGLNLFGMVFEI